MKCLVCQGKTKVTNTYTAADSVCRVRACTECGTRFDTIEIIVERIDEMRGSRQKA